MGQWSRWCGICCKVTRLVFNAQMLVAHLGDVHAEIISDFMSDH